MYIRQKQMHIYTYIAIGSEHILYTFCITVPAIVHVTKRCTYTVELLAVKKICIALPNAFLFRLSGRKCAHTDIGREDIMYIYYSAHYLVD